MPNLSYSNLKAAVLPLDPSNGKFELQLHVDRHRTDMVAGLPVESAQTIHIKDRFHYTPSTENFDDIMHQSGIVNNSIIWSQEFPVAEKAGAYMTPGERKDTADMFRSIAKDPSLTEQMRGFLEKFATAMVKALKL